MVVRETSFTVVELEEDVMRICSKPVAPMVCGAVLAPRMLESAPPGLL